jgi:hypothetical protein
MAASFPNGTQFAISSALATAVPVSAITNANPGVATATAHGYADGNIVLLNMPSKLNNRVVRVDNSSTNAFDLEGVNTTSTLVFPAGFGLGSAQLAATFTTLSQTVDSQTSGGEQQFAQWQYLEEGTQYQRPTFKNARVLTLTHHYDPSLAWHDALLEADLAGEVRVLRATLPNASKLYWSVYVGFDGQPSFNINENQAVVASFALASQVVTRYSA